MRLKHVLQIEESMFELFYKQGSLAGMKVYYKITDVYKLNNIEFAYLISAMEILSKNKAAL
jgi:hypothetical protein